MSSSPRARPAFLALVLLAAAPLAAGAADPVPDQRECTSVDLPARLALDFPDSRDGRTRMEATLRVGEESWPAAERAFRVDGELERRGRRVERFAYRFLPVPAPGPASLEFVRRPAAGRYRMHLRVVDEADNRCFLDERDVDVPARAGGGEDEPAAALVRLFAPRDRLLTGKVRFDADVRGDRIVRLGFELDGKRVLTRSRPPWTVELDLGPAPRLRRLAAVGLDRRGEEVARDEVLLNAGPHGFSVRLALARSASAPGREIEARAVVEVPEGESLESLDLLVNDELRATLYQPPFVMPLARPAEGGSAWVRAVAHLAGGGDAEATRFLGGGGGDVVEVDFVELLATVVDRRGRPVNDLRPEEISLLENGRPQSLRRMERVENVPIHAGVVIDTSKSMTEEMADEVEAAHRFFEKILTPRDRAAVITFDAGPRLAVRFTSRVDRLAGGLAGLQATGTTTALYDSLAFALHYFSGLEGKRALILLTDGEDDSSVMSFDDVLDFARRTGVAIYSIGLGVRTTPVDFGLALDRLARETGGRSYRIGRAAELDRVYEQIESELRAQYLLAYQSDAEGGDEYRTIEVEVGRPGVEVRTAPGYYP